jgi:hypothetical protein
MPLKQGISLKDLDLSPSPSEPETIAVLETEPEEGQNTSQVIPSSSDSSELDMSLLVDETSGKGLLTADERLSLITLIRRVEEMPYLYYTPNGACETYIKQIGNCTNTGKRIFMFSAANGVGKTAAGINILANIFFEANHKWFKHPIFTERWKLPKLFWFVTKDSTLREVVEPEIVKWFPKDRYKLTNEGKTHIYKLTTDTDFTVFFKTIDQDPETFESATLGAVVYDEPPPERIHDACSFRLRAGGLIFAQLTPLHRAAWTVDRWIMNEKMKKYVYVQYASVWENSKTKGVRGRLRESDINFMISQITDPYEYEARVLGKPTHLKGLVYKDFVAEEPYVIEPFDVSDVNEYQIYCVMDPHDRRFPAIGWYAIDKAGNYYIIGEWPGINDFNGKYYDELGDNNYTFEEIIKKIREYEKERKWKTVWRVMDPNRGRTPYGNSGLTVQEEFEKYDMYFDTDVNDDLAIGHSTVRNLLKIGNHNKPKIQVFSSCRNHIWSFLRYVYDEHEGKAAEKRATSEDVLDKGKDFMDITRYFSVSEFKFSYKFKKVTGWRKKLADKAKNGKGYMAA